MVIEMQEGNTYEKWNAYGQSKSANILFSIGLVKRLGDRGLLSFSLNPGGIATNLALHLDFAPGGDLDLLCRFDPRLLLVTGLLTLNLFFCSANLQANWIAIWLDFEWIDFTGARNCHSHLCVFRSYTQGYVFFANSLSFLATLFFSCHIPVYYSFFPKT